MSNAEFLPHRLMLNRALRKESADLRRHIDEYQVEYERRVGEYNNKLAGLRRAHDARMLELARELDQQYTEEREILQGLIEDVTKHVDAKLRMSTLYKMRGILIKERGLVQNDIKFLNREMWGIGKHIESLNERKRLLLSRADIADILELAALSGTDWGIKPCGDASDLLGEIEAALMTYGDVRGPSKTALLRLRALVTERAEYLPLIHYIDWVIGQEKRYSKQLRMKRDEAVTDRDAIDGDIRDCNEQISSLESCIEELAWRVRLNWAKPIVYLEAEITHCFHELHGLGETTRLDYDIKRISRRIEAKKVEKEHWIERRKSVCDLCRKYHAPIVSSKEITNVDESSIIERRLSEIQYIRERGWKDAEAACETRRQQIEADRDKQLHDLSAKRESLEDALSAAEADVDKAQAAFYKSAEAYEKAQKSDTRGFFVRMLSGFSETVEVEKARRKMESASACLLSAKRARHKAWKKVQMNARAISDATEHYKISLAECEPKPLRPDAGEVSEEENLNLLKERYIEMGRWRGANESQS